MNHNKQNTYYWTCPYCGANLDPQESCDCRKEKKDKADDYKLVQGGENENVQRSRK